MGDPLKEPEKQENPLKKQENPLKRKELPPTKPLEMEDLQAQDTMTTQVLMMVPDAHKEEAQDVDGTQPPIDVQKDLITNKDGANLEEKKEPEKAQTEKEDALNLHSQTDS